MGARRLLVRMPNWLGDIVMALPALAAMRGAWADAHVTAAAPRPLVDLLRLVPGVDDVIGLSGGSGVALLRGTHPDVAAVAAVEAETAVLLTNSFASALLMQRAGVHERWGYAADGRRWLLTRAIARRAGSGQSADEERRHHAAYYMRLVDALGFEPRSPVRLAEAARVALPPHVREAGIRVLERHGWRPGAPLVGVAPGAAYGGAKRWPPTAVADTIRRLAGTSYASGAASPTVVLVGAPSDRPSGVEVEEALRAKGDEALARPPRLVNLVGQTSLVEMVGVPARCRVFVSNDSGAMHVASAAGVPVVAMFGPTREADTHPLGAHTLLTADVFCRPCMLRECPIDHRCMKRITADRAAAAVVEWLADPSPGGREAP